MKISKQQKYLFVYGLYFILINIEIIIMRSEPFTDNLNKHILNVIQFSKHSSVFFNY